MTASEKIFWQEIRAKKLGFKFRRQHPKFGYVLDFYCDKLRLDIEIDGEYHEKNKAYDKWRDNNLAKCNIKVIRFTNSEVKNDMSNVLKSILRVIKERSDSFELM